MKSDQEPPPPAPAPAPPRITNPLTMTSARRPSDGEESIQETQIPITGGTEEGADAADAGGSSKDDRPNQLTDKEEQQAAAHRSRSKEEDARKKQEEARPLPTWLKRKRDSLHETIDRDKKKWDAHEKMVDKMREWLMLLAILAVSIAYAAGLNPPGGMWQDDSPGHHTAGMPVLQKNDPWRYFTFYYFNAMSFVTSLVIVALLLNRKTKVHTLAFITSFDLMCLVVAYLAGTTTGLPCIGLILIASAAFIYFARRMLILVCMGVLAALIGCLLFLCSPCIIAVVRGCLKPDGGAAEQNDRTRHERV